MRPQLVLIILISFSFHSKAGIILGPGIGINSSSISETKDKDGHSVLKSNGGALFAGDFELVIFRALTFNMQGRLSGSTGKAQYSFKNNTRPASNADVSHLETSISSFSGSFGPRLRILNFDSIKTYIGGGLIYGSINLKYDKDDFLKKHAALTEYKLDESKGYRGHYCEIGIEIKLNGTNALRLSGQQNTMNTSNFETLANKRVKMTNYSGMFQYLHYVDWSLFFK